MTNPVESAPEVMRRTKANLEFIQREREERKRAGHDVDQEGPFEVTQLANSFMGAFAQPFEALFKLQSPSETIREDLKILEKILLEEVWYSAPETPSLEHSLGYVRNAFAHGNIEFIGGMVEEPGNRPTRDIVEIRIWNCQPKGGDTHGWKNQIKTWEKELKVSELEHLLLTFVDAMSNIDPHHFKRTGDCPPRFLGG